MQALSLSPPLLTSPPRSLRRKSSNTFRAPRMDRHARISSQFPPLLHRDLALELASLMESRLGSDLLPSSVPDNVRSFQNQSGTSFGSLDIRYGAPGSSVDFLLESWLHCKVPTGAIDITTLLVYQNDSTDAPHFNLEFIQAGPTSLVLLLDLIPRRDLSFCPDYIDTFYQDTNVDKPRQDLEKLPQVVPYRSPSLYIRSIWSPTAILVSINCGEGGATKMEEIIKGTVASAAKEVLGIWLERCFGTGTGTEMGEEEREYMIRRDRVVKSKSIEIDLSANLPRLFDPDVANRVIAEICTKSTFQLGPSLGQLGPSRKF
ncbi:Red chlorophyll catabolite reductase [Rhynchospora pubera]|uniref:Red chlorophyll catabolite reductase n=1 Tax=Rhynchospora pubera TaxID=906938 RepID=A0AAV8C4N3_9POAL|nr:Red chlorophyll catabolite reductase [Rhynchospora pubera]